VAKLRYPRRFAVSFLDPGLADEDLGLGNGGCGGWDVGRELDAIVGAPEGGGIRGQMRAEGADEVDEGGGTVWQRE
jgi:hypothetical protein